MVTIDQIDEMNKKWKGKIAELARISGESFYDVSQELALMILEHGERDSCEGGFCMKILANNYINRAKMHGNALHIEAVFCDVEQGNYDRFDAEILGRIQHNTESPDERIARDEMLEMRDKIWETIISNNTRARAGAEMICRTPREVAAARGVGIRAAQTARKTMLKKLEEQARKESARGRSETEIAELAAAQIAKSAPAVQSELF